MEFGQIPAQATLKPVPFTAKVDEAELSDFKQLLKLSKIAAPTYENLQEDRYFGLSRSWLAKAKEYWETSYDWRKAEAYINSFPNFTVPLDDGAGGTMTMHFAALFSENPSAVPVLFMHGWPGSFLEFVGVIKLLQKRYTPKDLPYHVIVPSLPGYAYSSGPPVDRNWEVQDIAAALNRLMIGLGFESGYVAQGGDIGSFVGRGLAVLHKECKAVHFNLIIGIYPETKKKIPETSLSASEKEGVTRGDKFGHEGNAYLMMHATRPSTIGLVLASSPIALLAWIAEKFLTWTDEDPSLDTILDDVTLWWITGTFPRSIYTYRQFSLHGKFMHGQADLVIKKPMGYSWFPKELTPCPKAWAETTGDLVFWRQHERGGHFAALEVPELLLKDVEEFVGQVWPTAGKL